MPVDSLDMFDVLQESAFAPASGCRYAIFDVTPSGPSRPLHSSLLEGPVTEDEGITLANRLRETRIRQPVATVRRPADRYPTIGDFGYRTWISSSRKPRTEASCCALSDARVLLPRGRRRACRRDARSTIQALARAANEMSDDERREVLRFAMFLQNYERPGES